MKVQDFDRIGNTHHPKYALRLAQVVQVWQMVKFLHKLQCFIKTVVNTAILLFFLPLEINQHNIVTVGKVGVLNLIVS